MSTLGAGYIAAILTEDTDLIQCFETAYTAAELLAFSRSQILALGRRVAVDTERSMAEVGSQMIAAAVMFEQLDIQL